MQVGDKLCIQRLAVALTAIGGHRRRHVFGAFHPPFDLERIHPQRRQRGDMVEQRRIFEAECRFSLAAFRRKWQTAGLGAKPAVAAATAQQRGEIALSRHAHTQGPVDEHLDLTAASHTGGDLLFRHLAGEHHTRKADIAQKVDAGGSMTGQLCRGVQRHLRHRSVQVTGKTHVLHDEGVHPHLARFDRHAQRLFEFIVTHQGVKRQMHRHTARVAKRHRLFELGGRKIGGIAAGVE